jgi:hypothetical protein
MSSQLSDITTTNPKKDPITIGAPINIDVEQLGEPVGALPTKIEGDNDDVAEGSAQGTAEASAGDEEEDEEAIAAAVDETSVGLELGDIIDITAPLNEVLNNNRFYIDFINEDKIVLIDLKSFKKVQLNIDENGIIDNNSIANIALISRNEKKGYARQNNLLPGTWINILFGGDVPAIITGEITNLEEDMIEITTFPENRVIYIPFNYQGIPENIPIEQFEIRRKPEIQQRVPEVGNPLLENGKDQEGKEENEETQDQDVVIDPADLYEPDDVDDTEEGDKTALHPREQQSINKHILEDQIVFGEFNQPILQFVDLDVKFKRYNIDVQTNDLLDSLLSTIPTNQQTPTVLNNIHTSIERFTQLRTEFSKFNKNGVIDRITVKSHLHKPLKDLLASSSSNLYWILPVAKNEKKIYPAENAVVIVDNDVPDISRLQFYEDITNMSTIIEENKTMPISNDQNKYVELYNSLNPFFTPFNNINPNMDENANVLSQQFISYDKSVIIDNYGDLHSSAMNANALSRKRFFMQRYVTGLTHLDVIAMNSTSMDTTLVPLTPPDKMAITSYLTLPAPAIQFSKINLPGTDILTSSNLNTHFLNYWQLLKKNTRVNAIDVHLPDEDAPSIHSANAAIKRKEDQSLKNYFDSINHFVLKTRGNYDAANSAHFLNYLDKVIPTTKDIFNIMAKYIVGKVSLVNIVDVLEPFLIYSGDLTYKQYQIIVSFIDCKISKFNKAMLENKRYFNELKYINPKAVQRRIPFISTSASLFHESRVMYDMFHSYTYPDNTIARSESEWLKKLMMDDFGNVFNCSVALSTIYLKYPSHVSELLEFTNVHLKQDRLKDVAEDKCANYTIAKKYRVKTEIEADNGVEIYYDKEFDKTPYGLLDDYANERNKLNQDEFERFLVDKLRKKHKFGEQLSQEHAVSMIIGMKPIKEGDYAVFFNSVQNAFEFYVRENNMWRLDEAATKDMFQGSPDTLCNIQKDCLYSTQQVDGMCENLTVNKDNIQLNAMKNIMEQFDQKYETSKEEQTTKLLAQFDYYVAIIAKLKEINKYHKFKQTTANYEMGLTLLNDVDIIVSPYSKYLDIILGQEDLAKKYENILNFSRLCTRPPAERNEYPNFLYCIKTNTPLLPQFLHTLAMAFINNHENYVDVLNDVIRINGVISEEGDRIVDKHSGKLIALANFSEEEGFDAAGFQVRTREVEEADWADMQPEETSSGPGPLINVVMSPETQLINKIVNALSSATGISIPAQMEFIVRNVKNTVISILPTEEEHKERNEALEKKGKQTTSYEDQKNALFLYLTLGMFIIAVQTNVPSVKTRKSYPGCSSSFEGYPLEPGANKSFINYIACIAYKIRSNFAPWSVLLKKKEDYISSTIFNYIESYLVQIQEVNQNIKSKHEYLQSAEHRLLSSNIASIFSVKRMTTFLPSQIPIKMTHLAPVSQHFNQSLLDNLHTGSYKQTDQLNALQAIIIRFSYAIQEEIQKVVTEVITKNVKKQNKFNLLIHLGGKLALENACCNEENGNSFLQYFKDKNADISTFNDIVQSYSAILRDVKFYTTPCLFSSRINTKNMFPPLDVLFSSETIYKTFIHYCGFNSLKPIPTVLVPLCKDKPANFNRFEAIETQIAKLKNEGREYTNETMLQLLLIISSKNVINTTISQQTMTRLQKVRAIIENVYVKYRGAIIKTIPQAFQSHMMTTMDAYAVAQAGDENQDDLIDEMRDYLVNANKNLKKNILQFIKTNGKVPRGQLERMQNFLTTIMEWGKSAGHNISEDDMYNSINFIKTYLCNFIKIFPNVILTQNSLNTFQMVVPKHWNVSPNDASRIASMVTEYYTKLHHFYGNSQLTNVLQKVQSDLNVILELANDTPVGTRAGLGTFDKKTGLYLFEFYILTTLHGHIDAVNAAFVRPNRAAKDMDAPLVDAPLAAEEVEYDEYSSEISQGDLKEIKHHVAGLLMAYLELMEGHKITVNISYDFIMNSVFKIQQSEKDTFTSKLEKMSTDARKVDTLMKAHKLGDWNKGLQKGLTTYNKNLDDDELRAQNESYQRLERRLFANKDANPQNFEQYADDLLAEAAIEEASDAEEYGMDKIGEDFEDGNPYGEENED